MEAEEEADEFTNKFEREFSLGSFVSILDSSHPEVQVYERWVVYRRCCSHMTGMQEAFIFL